MKSPKTVLFQALTALIVEFFPCKLVRNDGSNNLPVELAAVL